MSTSYLCPLSLIGIGRTYQNIRTTGSACSLRIFSTLQKFNFCDKFATKVINHRDVLCASSAKGGWQLITTLIVAIDGGAVFSQFDLRFSQFYRKLSNFDLSRTLIALLTCTPPTTPLFRPISAAAGFNWKWLFIAWFGGYCNRPICHGAMLSYWTQWLCHALALWQNPRLSTT